jgi:DNA-binding response OmpR family regulator
LKLDEMNTALELPCAIATVTPTQGQTNPPQHILVVEDDSDLRQLSASVLIRFGYRVRAAEDGAAGWEALNADSYDLLITDHNMPRLTGVELVKKLRSARMALPVILATGHLPTEELCQNPSLQLAAMLPKPFSVDELLQTVRAVLRAADSSRERLEPLPDWRSQPSADGLELISSISNRWDERPREQSALRRRAAREDARPTGHYL